MKITASNLTHWAGLSAIVAGIMYVIVGLSHTFVSHYGGLASVTNDVWVLTHSLTIGVSFFGLLGIAGIYARQVEKAGWFGLAGFLLLSLWLVLVPGFTFFEALILPLLAVDAPNVAEGFLGIFTGSAGATSGSCPKWPELESWPDTVHRRKTPCLPHSASLCVA